MIILKQIINEKINIFYSNLETGEKSYEFFTP
jgi:hypothetical protein